MKAKVRPRFPRTALDEIEVECMSGTWYFTTDYDILNVGDQITVVTELNVFEVYVCGIEHAGPYTFKITYTHTRRKPSEIVIYNVDWKEVGF